MEGRGRTMESEKTTIPKPQQPIPAPPTQPVEENELLAKLKRRQNKITEAEQIANVAIETVEVTNEAIAAEEPVQSKPPPPPPQRKTPALHTTPPQPVVAVQDEAPPVKQKKIMPPPPKPKDAEPEMSPWQQELAARKARMADHEKGRWMQK